MQLERLFENLALNVEPFALCEVSRGWRLRVQGLDHVSLHFVLSGEGRLNFGTGSARELRPYSLAVVPQRFRHEFQCGDTAPRETATDNGSANGAGLRRFVAGATHDPELVIACGKVEVIYAGGLGVFDLLEEPMILDFSDSLEMRTTFARLLDESEASAPGSGAMMTALMNECLVMVFRRIGGSPELRLPWVLALEDPRMARVLSAVLERPENPHSLESLARKATMSRSAFAQEFTARFGRTPMAFVRDVRLRRGAELLRSTDLSVDAVARRVGFASRSHFSQAFRERFGLSPTPFRVVPA